MKVNYACTLTCFRSSTVMVTGVDRLKLKTRRKFGHLGVENDERNDASEGLSFSIDNESLTVTKLGSDSRRTGTATTSLGSFVGSSFNNSFSVLSSSVFPFSYNTERKNHVLFSLLS